MNENADHKNTAQDNDDDPLGLDAGLVTGLERTCLKIDRALDQALIRESAIVREFSRRAHHYLQEVPEDGSWIEWLALMQHHGAPTRLLDWTYSLQVAAHFAVKKASQDPKGQPAIWMVNTLWCRHASEVACGPTKVPTLVGRPFRRDTEAAASRELLLGNLPPCVWPVNPFRLNERLTLQKGVFLAPADVTESFAANLRALEGHNIETNLACFILTRDAMPPMAKELYDSNVTETTLFPGIDGFARSLFQNADFLNLEGLRTLHDVFGHTKESENGRGDS